MGTADGALGVLRSWLGTSENPRGSNRTWIGAAFGWNGVAWCAECQSLALARSNTPGLWSASCYVLIEQLKVQGRWHGKVRPAPGMLAFYSSAQYPNGGAHVNMVESVSGSSMTGIGGNEGDAVRRSVRSISSAYGFGTPPYSAMPVPVPPPPTPPTPPKPDEEFLMALTDKQQQDLANQVFNVQEWLKEPALENRVKKAVKAELDAFGLRLSAWLDTDKDGGPGPFPTD